MKNRKLLKTIVLIVLLLMICAILLCGCDDNNSTIAIDNDSNVNIGKENIDKYHAKLYIPEKSWFKKEFLDNNWTAGMTIEGEYDEYGYPIIETFFVVSDTYPKKRSYIIRTQNEFYNIFQEFSHEINFNQQMALLLLKTDIDLISEEYTVLSKIDICASELSIGYSSTLDPSLPSATSPIQKYILVVMDKIDIDNVNFN